MIPQSNTHKPAILSAYSDMLITEASDSNAKKIHKTVVDFLNKNKADIKDIKKALKMADLILKPDSEDIDWINVVASLSNHFKDSGKHEKELEKILDMI